MKYPAFVGPSYIAQAYTADDEDCINLYPESSESQGATTEMSLYPIPGVSEFTGSPVVNGPGRANFFMGDRQFAVIGTDFIEIDTNGNFTDRGDVAIDGNPATISSNGDGGGQLFITSGTNGYNYDLGTNTLTQIAALNGIATVGAYLGGYFLALNSATSTFYISALLDGTSWTTGTDFAQRSIAPDPWLSMKVSGRNLYLLGQQTSEIWIQTGAAFPFEPAPSGLIRYGIAAQYSAAILGNDVIWIGGSKEGRANVLRTPGYQPEVISTYALQNAISSYATIEDAQGDSYSDRGHNFYLLTFPTEGVTWVWDSETGKWHKRQTWIAEESRWVAWRPRWHAFAFNQHRMLDGESGAYYQMDITFPLDAEERPIRRVRRAPSLMNEMERVFYAKFALDMEPATTLSHTGQSTNPQVMMRFSDDGGKTWSSEQWRSGGKVGQFQARPEWFRLGTARRRVFEVAWAEPVPWRVTQAYLEFAQPVGGGGE